MHLRSYVHAVENSGGPGNSMAKRNINSYEPPANKIEQKNLQGAKIREIGEALIDSGFRHVVEQSKVLNVPRSTAWVITQAKYKASGLSAHIIQRMLASPDLPPIVREKVFEYIDEKTIGLYGDSKKQLVQFKKKLAECGILAPSEIDSNRSQRQRKEPNAVNRRDGTKVPQKGLRSHSLPKVR